MSVLLAGTAAPSGAKTEYSMPQATLQTAYEIATWIQDLHLDYTYQTACRAELRVGPAANYLQTKQGIILEQEHSGLCRSLHTPYGPITVLLNNGKPADVFRKIKSNLKLSTLSDGPFCTKRWAVTEWKGTDLPKPEYKRSRNDGWVSCSSARTAWKEIQK